MLLHIHTYTRLISLYIHYHALRITLISSRTQKKSNHSFFDSCSLLTYSALIVCKLPSYRLHTNPLVENAHLLHFNMNSSPTTTHPNTPTPITATPPSKAYSQIPKDSNPHTPTHDPHTSYAHAHSNSSCCSLVYTQSLIL